MDKNTASKATETKTAATNTAATATAEKATAPKKHVPIMEVLKAQYGINGNMVDVKDAVTEHGIKLNRRKLTNKLIGSDPAPKKVKSLVLSYCIDGGKQQEVTIMEGELIELNLPAPPAAEVAPATEGTK